MISNLRMFRVAAALARAAAVCLVVLVGACSSSSSSTSSDGGGSTSSDGGTAVATCASPGMATPGPADDHCASAGADGGALVNTVNLACDVVIDAGDDGGGGGGCPYGATQYGNESDDDDCKYHVTWTATPICEQPGAVTFTVVVKYKAGAAPVTAAGLIYETFTASPGDWDAASYCDDQSTHLGPLLANNNKLTEGPPGTYVGPIAFDKPGVWTVRFHFFENCTDAPTAPHGHVAFHITVP